jgi:class 3 adenylate cyclase
VADWHCDVSLVAEPTDPHDRTPEGSVVIGASTYDLIRDHVVVRELGSPALKGKSRAVEVYELLGLRHCTE